ncbi:hypothetical protein [Spirosoma panaciterrae]|uniref:hypothetical protein n=1 Tax=Spirosoma panaciterrae TaxID=496058 RepID=UPI000361C148|nr:hypothetical protein [Spirosoma panaciterrae]
MTEGFWVLPGQIQLAIRAPQSVVQRLVAGIHWQQRPSRQAVRTVWVDWAEAEYIQYRAIYWQAHFTQEEVIWSQRGEDWLFLGAGFFLAYSQTTDSARFFAQPAWEDDVFTYSYPFLNLLIQVLNRQGYTPLHAAVIGKNDQFVLLPGKQNTGKSTTAATWVMQGGQFVTDDFCFLQANDPTTVYGFYPSFRIRKEALSFLSPYLSASQLQQKGDSKYFFSTLTHCPDRFVPQASIRSIFCLTLHNRTLSHTHVGPQVGFAYLASSIAFAVQHRATSQLCVQAIRTMVRTLPVVQVNLTPNGAENYAYLNELIGSG